MDCIKKTGSHKVGFFYTMSVLDVAVFYEQPKFTLFSFPET